MVELVKNGGFEDGLNYWRSFEYGKCSMNATVTSSKAHSGKYSLATRTGNATEIECGGSRASQAIILPKGVLSLKFSFSVYSDYVGPASNGECFAMIISFWIGNTYRCLVYYIYWDPDRKVFSDFPPPSQSTKNVTSILIHRLTAYQWNHIERDLTEDLKKYHIDIDLNNVDVVLIMMAAVRSYLKNPIYAYWDDISLRCELSEPPKTPLPSTPGITPSPILPSPTPSPPVQVTPTTPQPTVTPTQTFQKDGLVNVKTLFGVAAVVLVIFIAVLVQVLINHFKLKSKDVKTETTLYPSSPEPEKHSLASEYDRLVTEQQSIKQKIAKLTDSYVEGKVSEEAYKTLKAEYDTALSKIEQSIHAIRNKIDNELKSLIVEETEITKSLELLEAKNILGDITKEQYQKDKSKLEEKLAEINGKKSTLASLLDAMK
ncbi:MAG: hypothetical protein QXP38_04310 [Nitrososphaerota archaeon]